MERELFDWVDWDDVGDHLFVFMNCDLKVPIGTFKKGDNVSEIRMDYDAGTIELCMEGEPEPRCRFKMHLRIGEQMQLDQIAVESE